MIFGRMNKMKIWITAIFNMMDESPKHNFEPKNEDKKNTLPPLSYHYYQICQYWNIPSWLTLVSISFIPSNQIKVNTCQYNIGFHKVYHSEQIA